MKSCENCIYYKICLNDGGIPHVAPCAEFKDSSAAVTTPEEFKIKMAKIANNPHYDEEEGHGGGDWLMMKTLIELGYGEGVEIFDNMPKWYA